MRRTFHALRRASSGRLERNAAESDLYRFCRLLATAKPSPTPRIGGDLTINGVSLGKFDFRVANGNITTNPFIASDWFTNTEDTRAAFIIVNGNLVIPTGQIFIPPVRKLFTVLYVTGNLVVDGELSMSRRGANHSGTGNSGGATAAGSIKIIAGTFSGVTNPQVPAAGGAAIPGRTTDGTGSNGTNGTNGGTGGGGVGRFITSGPSGGGAAGTSFSGGAGGGGARAGAATDGGASGGAGGNGGSNGSTHGAGGAGNPAGTGVGESTGAQTGTGGVLIGFVLGTYSGSGSVTSSGANGGVPISGSGGGGSGGGSVTLIVGVDGPGPLPSAIGGTGGTGGGNGGNGTARRLLFTGSSSHYVSPTGSSSNDGSISSPWSLAHAASGAGGAIRPGDTVLLRGGTYYSTTGYDFSLSGLSTHKITFKNYPGETPVVDGSYSEFRTSPGSSWQVHSGSVYKSTNTSYTGEHYGYIQIGSDFYPLATHKALGDLTASAELYSATDNYYVGPGIVEDPVGGQIYVRLDNIAASVQPGRTIAQVADNDPRNQALYIFGTQYGIRANGQHLIFDGIEVNNFYSLVQGGNNCTFKNMIGKPGYVAGRTGGASFDNCTFDGRLTDNWWGAYTDIKNGRLVADHCRKVAFITELSTLQVTNCTIKNFFDGILGSGIHDTEIANSTFDYMWDDGWQMNSDCYEVNIHHNTYLGAGPSHNGPGSGTQIANPGTVYIHHNVIDVTTKQVYWTRDGNVGWESPIALSTHATPGASAWSFPWKLYYNTIVMDDETHAVYVGAGLFGVTSAGNHYNTPHEAYNNIFVMGNRAIARDVKASTGYEIYDGNVYYDYPGHIWRFIHTTTGTPGPVADIAAMRSSQALADSQVYYAPGWEASGIDNVNPQLDANYKPQATAVQTGAVDITSKGWPGASVYEAHRGAIAP